MGCRFHISVRIFPKSGNFTSPKPKSSQTHHRSRKVLFNLTKGSLFQNFGNLVWQHVRFGKMARIRQWYHLFATAYSEREFLVSLYLFSSLVSRGPYLGTRDMRRILSLNSLLLNWPMLEIYSVLCTSHCVVFIMFPLSWDRSLGRCF